MKPEATNSLNGFVKKNYDFLVCRPRYEGMVKITNQATVPLREAVRLRRGEGNWSCGTIFQPQKSLEKYKKGRVPYLPQKTFTLNILPCRNIVPHRNFFRVTVGSFF
jgi:hypothetical protein